MRDTQTNSSGGSRRRTFKHQVHQWTGREVTMWLKALDLSSYIAKNTSIPVIGHGGASSINDINEILSKTDLSGVALGSMVLYQKKGMGVLINFPNKRLLSQY